MGSYECDQGFQSIHWKGSYALPEGWIQHIKLVLSYVPEKMSYTCEFPIQRCKKQFEII